MAPRPRVILIALVISTLIVVRFSPTPRLSSWREECKEVPRIVQSSIPAGQGVQGRIQCWNSGIAEEDSWPVEQVDNLIFVTMFVPSASALASCPGHESPLDRQFSVLKVFLESSYSVMPYARQVLLVDPEREVLGRKLPPNVRMEPIPGNYSRANLMLQRLETYRTFLDTCSGQENIVFADSDMILVEGLGRVFDDNSNFDVALTYRNNRQQPVNSGLIFVRGTSLDKAKHLLGEVIRCYKQEFMSKSRMMGDQLAFAKIVREEGESVWWNRGEKILEKRSNNMTLAMLPCSLYNWTPPEGAGQFHGMPVNVKVIHFKGSRKRLMLKAWEMHENPNKMKCFILRSGRAKYDF